MQMANGFAQAISTHAPRTGSDPYCGAKMLLKNISTHAPRTGSDIFAIRQSAQKLFQPTLPARGATLLLRVALKRRLISTHAPRTGSDDGNYFEGVYHMNFNPRSPHGERQHHPSAGQRHPDHFNPRSPHGERPAPRGSGC